MIVTRQALCQTVCSHLVGIIVASSQYALITSATYSYHRIIQDSFGVLHLIFDNCNEDILQSSYSIFSMVYLSVCLSVHARIARHQSMDYFC